MSVSAEIRPPTSELSPAFMLFCTALDSSISKIRSNGSYCPICRRPVRRRNSSSKAYTARPRATNSHQGTLR